MDEDVVAGNMSPDEFGRLAVIVSAQLGCFKDGLTIISPSQLRQHVLANRTPTAPTHSPPKQANSQSKLDALCAHYGLAPEVKDAITAWSLASTQTAPTQLTLARVQC